ncbi:MAG: CPBP family intramembrane glutamic endopeptidase [Pseudomonadales bacterium]
MDQSINIHPRQAWEDLKREHVTAVVLVTTAVMVTVIEYFFLPESLRELFPQIVQKYAPGVWYGSWASTPVGSIAPWWGVFAPWAWWMTGMLVFWVAVPMVCAKSMGFYLRDLGLSMRGLLPKLWIYGLLYLIVLVGIWWASKQQGFTNTYPMLKPWYNENWCWLVLLSWWALYAVQFFVVEFFFRGWMLFTLEKRMGMAAIAVTIVPYCMIHYHKPAPEALGAIVGGLVLGWLALKTRSIWGGWLVHVGVAITMDVAALTRGEWGMPTSFWP